MEITLNVNINAPAIVDVLKTILAEGKDSAAKTERTLREVISQNKEAAASTVAEAPKEEKKTTKKTAAKTEAPAPAAAETKAAEPKAAPEGKIKTVDDARARLSEYAAANKLGGQQVVEFLRTQFNVARISELPVEKYADFERITEGGAADPLS